MVPTMVPALTRALLAAAAAALVHRQTPGLRVGTRFGMAQVAPLVAAIQEPMWAAPAAQVPSQSVALRDPPGAQQELTQAARRQPISITIRAAAALGAVVLMVPALRAALAVLAHLRAAAAAAEAATMRMLRPEALAAMASRSSRRGSSMSRLAICRSRPTTTLTSNPAKRRDMEAGWIAAGVISGRSRFEERRKGKVP